MEIRSDETASYSEKHGYRIENISFRDINFYNCPENIMESVIRSDFEGNEPDSGYGISGVHFENVTYDNKPIEYSEKYIITGGNVTDITVE